MTRREFNAWKEYHKRWPFDDLHRYHKPAALIALRTGMGGKSKFSDMLDVLHPYKPPAHPDQELIDVFNQI